MSDLIYEVQDNLCLLTVNRPSKHNAFDDHLVAALRTAYHQAAQDVAVKVIVLKACGPHFSAGADLEWMQRMAQYTLAENLRDANALAELLQTIYACPKPTIAMAQGSTYGGGVGLVAASDVGIAATTARFCFSETRLGILPAVISPFVIKAIGEREAKALFMSAEVFDAPKALALHLLHHCVEASTLLDFTLEYAKNLCRNAPLAVLAAKQLVHQVANKPIDKNMAYFTANLIAHKRVSSEGQHGLAAFLRKEKPHWS